jgi:hypothetical protein
MRFLKGQKRLTSAFVLQDPLVALDVSGKIVHLPEQTLKRDASGTFSETDIAHLESIQ